MECLIRKPREREVAKVERKERFRRQRRPGVHIFFLRSLSQKERETEREGTRVSSFSFFLLSPVLDLTFYITPSRRKAGQERSLGPKRDA